MKLKNTNQIDEFLSAINKCKHGVKLVSVYGDVYDLKSKLTQYIAIAALLGNHGDELELYCQNTEDEPYFFRFFNDNPDTL